MSNGLGNCGCCGAMDQRIRGAFCWLPQYGFFTAHPKYLPINGGDVANDEIRYMRQVDTVVRKMEFAYVPTDSFTFIPGTSHTFDWTCVADSTISAVDGTTTTTTTVTGDKPTTEVSVEYSGVFRGILTRFYDVTDINGTVISGLVPQDVQTQTQRTSRMYWKRTCQTSAVSDPLNDPIVGDYRLFCRHTITIETVLSEPANPVEYIEQCRLLFNSMTFAELRSLYLDDVNFSYVYKSLNADGTVGAQYWYADPSTGINTLETSSNIKTGFHAQQDFDPLVGQISDVYLGQTYAGNSYYIPWAAGWFMYQYGKDLPRYTQGTDFYITDTELNQLRYFPNVGNFYAGISIMPLIALNDYWYQSYTFANHDTSDYIETPDPERVQLATLPRQYICVGAQGFDSAHKTFEHIFTGTIPP